jgi:hypothetical protein
MKAPLTRTVHAAAASRPAYAHLPRRADSQAGKARPRNNDSVYGAARKMAAGAKTHMITATRPVPTPPSRSPSRAKATAATAPATNDTSSPTSTCLMPSSAPRASNAGKPGKNASFGTPVGSPPYP